MAEPELAFDPDKCGLAAVERIDGCRVLIADLDVPAPPDPIPPCDGDVPVLPADAVPPPEALTVTGAAVDGRYPAVIRRRHGMPADWPEDGGAWLTGMNGEPLQLDRTYPGLPTDFAPGGLVVYAVSEGGGSVVEVGEPNPGGTPFGPYLDWRLIFWNVDTEAWDPGEDVWVVDANG